MHTITELPAWERLSKRILWQQIGELKNLRISDYASGEGVTACHFTAANRLTAIEPCEAIVQNAWTDFHYNQITGREFSLSEFKENIFDYVICHNVLEYVENASAVISELTRV